MVVDEPETLDKARWWCWSCRGSRGHGRGHRRARWPSKGTQNRACGGCRDAKAARLDTRAPGVPSATPGVPRAPRVGREEVPGVPDTAVEALVAPRVGGADGATRGSAAGARHGGAASAAHGSAVEVPASAAGVEEPSVGGAGSGTGPCRQRSLQAYGDRHGIRKIREELKICSVGSGSLLGKGKISLIKYDMTQDDDAIRHKVKAAVSFVVSRIAKKNT